MKHQRSALRRHAQRGSVAVEAAAVLLVMTTLLSYPLFFARCFWHYTVIQKAAHDATLFLATVPRGDMRHPVRGVAAANIATYIARAETAELDPGGIYPVVVDVDCLPAGCGLGTPTGVRVTVGVRMFDPFFGIPFLGEEGLLMYSDVEMDYVGS